MSLARAFEQRQADASAVNSSAAAPKGSSRRAVASPAPSGAMVQDGKTEGPRPCFRRLTAGDVGETTEWAVLFLPRTVQQGPQVRRQGRLPHGLGGWRGRPP